jgi:hypothetical protein
MVRIMRFELIKPEGDGFTVRRDSPTSPYPQINKIINLVAETGFEPVLAAFKVQCLTNLATRQSEKIIESDEQN